MAMAAISIMLLLVSALMLIIPSSLSAVVVAPIKKDATTRQYAVAVYLKTPLQPTNLLLDLGASFSWVDCTKNYVSKTYRNVPCNTALCISVLHSGACFNSHDGPQAPGNSNDSCALFPENPISTRRQTSMEDALIDSFALPTTAGKLSVLPDFVMSCAKTSLLKGFPKNVTGLAAFGRFALSLSSQFSGAYPTPPLFALCLPSTDKASGAAVFNTRGPYYFSSGNDLAKSLIYTPLLLNPVDFRGSDSRYPSDEYFIGVTSIKVNGKPLTLKNQKQLLTIDANGYGGTRISTVVPYARLQTSIYAALIQAYTVESFALKLRLTIPEKPFGFCYDAKSVPITTVGPAVPTVDLVMGSKDVFWRISGANLMVRVKNKINDLWCLGIVDGGAKPRSAIVIGGLQLEDNLLEFDVKSKRLGFTSSVLAHGTSCAKFNFHGK